MGLVTILRGFKVPLRVLDDFLIANGIASETETLCSGIPPLYDEETDIVTTLLRNKVGSGDTKTQLFVPYKMGFDRASNAYIAYDWIMVFAQRKVKPDELSDTPPAGFEELRKEILSYSEGLVDDPASQNGLYVIVTDERSYAPTVLWERETNVKCDQCDATFEDGCWSKRQAHRQNVHGSRDGTMELPEDA